MHENSVTQFLISISGVFLVGTIGEVIFKRTRIPDVLWLILMGMLIGPVFHIVSRAQLLNIAPYFGALTLVFVLFEGGIRLDLVEVYRSATRSVLLSFMTFIFSATGLTLACHLMVRTGLLPGDWTWRQELLVGAILGGTSPIVIIAAVMRAGVDAKVMNLLSIESALSDVICIVTVSTLIEAFGRHGNFHAGATWWLLLRSLGIGLFAGAVAGMLWLFILDRLKQNEHAYPITLSALLLLYVVVDNLGGSPALGVLAFALVVGNATHIGARIRLSSETRLDDGLRDFHSQMVFIVKSFFFTYVGAMLGPPWGFAVAGAVLAIVILGVRFPGAWLALFGLPLNRDLRRIVYVSAPRGVAAGVLAALPFSAGIPGTSDLPVIVFASVFTGILIFSISFPLVQRRPANAQIEEPS